MQGNNCNNRGMHIMLGRSRKGMNASEGARKLQVTQLSCVLKQLPSGRRHFRKKELCVQGHRKGKRYGLW